jgi:hypothetical protein
MRFLITALVAYLLILPTGIASAQGFDYSESELLEQPGCVLWLKQHPDYEIMFGYLPPPCYWHPASWSDEQEQREYNPSGK